MKFKTTYIFMFFSSECPIEENVLSGLCLLPVNYFPCRLPSVRVVVLWIFLEGQNLNLSFGSTTASFHLGTENNLPAGAIAYLTENEERRRETCCMTITPHHVPLHNLAWCSSFSAERESVQEKKMGRPMRVCSKLEAKMKKWKAGKNEKRVSWVMSYFQ